MKDCGIGTHKNPFQITSPEDLTAEETISLFVDVFSDFQKVIDPGHVFLMGPRGAGKSMMFRYLQPDCQCLRKKCMLNELQFLGIYIPLKNTNFTLTELQRLEDRHASDILSEHILVTHFCVKIFQTIGIPALYELVDANETKRFYNDIFIPLLLKVGYNGINYNLGEEFTTFDIFKKIAEISETMYVEAFKFAKQLAFRKDIIAYEGPLCDYIDFLLPILTNLSRLSFFPNGPIYLLVDDAHWLTETQTRALNSWVATRTSRKVSLKISTQYNYKTYYTSSGATIDTPHDFSEVDIATIYTGSIKSKYRDRIEAIVERRLKLFGINDVSAVDFFPVDEKQELKIKEIADNYRKKHDNGEARGYYRSDDALRYARPDYIKSLAGSSKSSSTYSYSGFIQLVHLSSGVVRHFLHPAHHMYALTKSLAPKEPIKFIPSSIQDSVVREEANNFLFTDLEKIEKEGHSNAPPKEDIRKLSNLVQGLGGTFRQIILSARSERRVFSIAISDGPSKQVNKILELGKQLGYFHKSTIGRKDSRSGGRTRLYILNRRLAPIWNLDPTGFAGYLFVTNSLLEALMENPNSMLRRFAKTGLPEKTENVQLELF